MRTDAAGLPTRAPARPGRTRNGTRRHRPARSLLATLAVGLALVLPAPASGQADEVPIHDPVLIEADSRFYLFGTAPGITVWTSPDLESWRPLPPVFDETPGWVLELIPEFDHNIWAPDIYEHDGTYYLYYSVSQFGRNGSAIGVATTPTLDPEDPEFGWTDHGMVLKSVPGRDMWNAIDAHVLHDRDGTPWMSFGSHWGGIKLVQLDEELTGVASPPTWRGIAARHRYWKLDERDAGDSA
ncbi:MAG: family 43 glycosylhydrolase, partial [Longimicrobiales bacterium]|nr:family 43 glycosylhydrolase [Longimicrobiales bacterium]